MQVTKANMVSVRNEEDSDKMLDRQYLKGMEHKSEKSLPSEGLQSRTSNQDVIYRGFLPWHEVVMGNMGKTYTKAM